MCAFTESCLLFEFSMNFAQMQCLDSARNLSTRVPTCGKAMSKLNRRNKDKVNMNNKDEDKQ